MADWMQKWDPRNEWMEFKDKMSEFFSVMPFQGKRFMQEFGKREWYPAMDMKETKGDIIVTVELPGLSENDIAINASEDSLEIKGERKETREIEDKKAGYIRKERSYGKFFRRLPLPAMIKPGKAEASFEKGILRIVMPKAVKGKAKKGFNIKINKGEEK